jgi:hypothetical protein
MGSRDPLLMHANAPSFARQARAHAQADAAQGKFDFLMPFGPGRDKLTPAEVAMCIGREVQFVYDELNREDSVFEVLRVPSRIRSEIRILRRSVLVWLALSAMEGNLQPEFFMERVARLIDAMQPAQLDACERLIAKRRTRL